MGLLWLKGYSLSRATGYLRDRIYLFSFNNMTSCQIGRGSSGICLGELFQAWASPIYLFLLNNLTYTHIDRQANGICLGQIIHPEGTQLEKQRVRLKVETSTCSQLF